ncbi:putative hydrolases of HD superfamily [Ruminococcaceae bacterium YAD3003]|nr:putative hydrolases of HD superfamily [Ruminococcaceae bacterium YAD3003]
MSDRERLQKQIDFIKEIDKEKMIKRQSYLTDCETHENDAEHAWHMAIMTLLLKEYANEEIDVLKTVTMLLIHDLVEVYAGDTYAYDEEGKKTQAEREAKAADKLYGILPEDQGEYFKSIWLEFEEQKTPEAKFARTMDCFQPLMLNDATNGRAWKEHDVRRSWVMNRNKNTSAGSEELWQFAKENFIDPNVENGNIIDDREEK